MYQVWLAASSPDGPAEMTEEYCSEVLEPYEFTEVARYYATPRTATTAITHFSHGGSAKARPGASTGYSARRGPRGSHDILPGARNRPGRAARNQEAQEAEPKDHSVLNIGGGVHRTVTSQLLGGPYQAMSPHFFLRSDPSTTLAMPQIRSGTSQDSMSPMLGIASTSSRPAR